MKKSLLLAGVAVTLLARPANAQEWTRFRGPNGTGISTAKTIPVTFKEADFNWKVALPGIGHSSPVVWGDKVFITSAEEGTFKRHLLCLSTKDGKVLWKQDYDYSAYPRHNFNTAASSTPAVDKDAVYVVWGLPERVTLHALTHAGKEIWKAELGPYPSQHGAGMSPIVVGDMVVVNKMEDGAGGVYAVDRKTGQPRWKYEWPSSAAIYSTPLLYEPQGGPPQLITSGSTGFLSLDPKTGKPNWEVRDVFKARCVSSPVLFKGMIVGTAGNGGGDRQAAIIRPGTGGSAPQVAYQPTKGIGYVPTPIAVGDYLFLWGDGGIVTCLKADTGEQVWMERVNGRFFGSPVCVDGKLYAMDDRGTLVVLEAGPTFKELGRVDLGEQSHATPAISDGVMYLRTVSHLISVGGKKN